MTTTLSVSNPYFDNSRLLALQIMLCQRMGELLSELNINLSRSGKMFYGCCPVHGGDNPSAMNLYMRGDSVPGYWQCHTRHCEKIFKSTIIGFVRGVLSHQRCDWTCDGNRGHSGNIVAFKKTIDWCCDFLGTTISKIAVNYEEIEKRKFASDIATLTKQPNRDKGTLTRSQARSRLQIPAAYFIERGWSSSILDKYDVGYCGDPKKPFFKRAVVPLYDNEHKLVVGYTARSTWPKCEKCSLWHAPANSCPETEEDKWACAKWRNSLNFKRESHLYNYWFAKKLIKDSRAVILVEGPGEVWRLEEAGIHIGVAMMGANLTDQQQVLLEMSGAMHVIVLSNNDETGKMAANILRETLGRSFRLYFPQLSTNDLGDMSPDAVRELLLPVLVKIREHGY